MHFRWLVTKASMCFPRRTKKSALIPKCTLTTTFPADPPFFCRCCPPAGTSAELYRPSCHNVVGMERECHSTHTHTPFPPLPSALSTTTTKDHTHTPDLSIWTNHARAHGSGLSVPPWYLMCTCTCPNVFMCVLTDLPSHSWAPKLPFTPPAHPISCL